MEGYKMIIKKEIMMRLCEAENNIEWLYSQLDIYEKRLKKVESKRGAKRNETQE